MGFWRVRLCTALARKGWMTLELRLVPRGVCKEAVNPQQRLRNTADA